MISSVPLFSITIQASILLMFDEFWQNIRTLVANLVEAKILFLNAYIKKEEYLN